MQTFSTFYTGPIAVSFSETVNAIATASGFTQSAVGSAIYTIAPLTALWSDPLPSGQAGVPYGPYTLTASGGTPPYVFDLEPGFTLPAGLTLVNGVISGTPTTAVTLLAESFGVTDSSP